MERKKVTIKVLRVAAGLKQSDVSERYGISQQMLSAYENGKQVPTIESALILTVAYGVTVEEIIISLGYDLESIKARFTKPIESAEC